MKLLFDQNLSFQLCRQLADLYPGSAQVRLLELAEANDQAIWQYAKVHGFALVTLDADFSDMAIVLGPPPKVIWLRCGNQPTETVATLLRDRSEAIAAFESDAAACLEIY
jgi:predicted nuclease of predicted toxin-antitoxin system